MLWTPVQEFLEDGDDDAVRCYRQAQWDKLCLVASNANRSLGCVALGQVACGLNNVVRLLEFSDGSHWAARVNIKASLWKESAELGAEIATMQFIKERSDLPVPKVFAYELNNDNPVGDPYILMAVIPGIVAMDALGGHKVHRSNIPAQYRQMFYRSVARCHVQITSLRLAKIGTVVRSADGTYGSGPLPGIGGPFNTAAAFFEAWADSVKFKWDRNTIESIMQRGPISAEDMIFIIDRFPSQIKAIASQLSAHNEGPFPLDHDDFLHSNIMVDESTFDFTGIIDWKGRVLCPGIQLRFLSSFRLFPLPLTSPRHMMKTVNALTRR